MSQNILHGAWSEKIAHVLEEELDDSARKSSSGRRRSFNNTDNDSYFNNTPHISDSGLASNEEAPFQRRTRSNRYLTSEDIEYDAPNIPLKTPSSDTLYSRGSRNLSRPSPPGSYRSIRNTSILNISTPRREVDKDGINIIMLIGFSVGIAFGTIFNIMEVYFKWLQLKISDMQMQFFGGKTISDFYLHEESTARKFLYSPMSGFCLMLQSIIYVVLICLDFLKKPAPKALVSNVMMRYVNE